MVVIVRESGREVMVMWEVEVLWILMPVGEWIWLVLWSFLMAGAECEKEGL